MLYCPRYFTEVQLTDLYNAMPANMAEVSGGSLERTQAGYFKELQRVSNLEGQFLEIGPDVGLFAENCLRKGNFRKFWMFEPNVQAHSELRQRFAGVDLKVSTTLLDLSPVPDAQISAVAMIHVLDHLLDPAALMRELRPKMTGDGVVLIVTHDESSLLAKLIRQRWPAYCLQHPQLFNPGVMRKLLARADFELVKTIKSVNHFPLSFLGKHAALTLGIEMEFPLFRKIEVPLQLGNFISIAKPRNSA